MCSRQRSEHCPGCPSLSTRFLGCSPRSYRAPAETCHDFLEKMRDWLPEVGDGEQVASTGNRESPEAHRRVVAGAQGETTVGRDCEGKDGRSCVKSAQLVAAVHVPEADRFVRTARGNCLSIWTERDGSNVVVVTVLNHERRFLLRRSGFLLTLSRRFLGPLGLRFALILGSALRAGDWFEGDRGQSKNQECSSRQTTICKHSLYLVMS